VPQMPSGFFVSALPPAIHLLNFFVRDGVNGTGPLGPQYVLRLHHTIEVAAGGVPVSVDLSTLFPACSLQQLTPTTLTLQWPASYTRQTWPAQVPSAADGAVGGAGAGAGARGQDATVAPVQLPSKVQGTVVTVAPMDILTFTLYLSC
jgi:hypothetical protein